MLSNYLAELVGIVMVIIPLALIVKEQNLRTLFASMSTDLGMVVVGFGSVLAGSAMVLSHNLWVKDWRVVITIFAWALLIRGLVQLFAPDICRQMMQKAQNFAYLQYALIVVTLVGLILVYLGFTA